MNDDECKGGMKFFKQACGLLKVGTGAIDQQTNLAIARQINHDLWNAISGCDVIKDVNVAELDKHFSAAMQASQKAMTAGAVHRLHQVLPGLTIEHGNLAAHHGVGTGAPATLGTSAKMVPPTQFRGRMEVPASSPLNKGFDRSLTSAMKGNATELFAPKGNGPSGLLDMISKMPNPLGMLKTLFEFLGALFESALEGVGSILGELNLDPSELYKNAAAATSDALKRKFNT